MSADAEKVLRILGVGLLAVWLAGLFWMWGMEYGKDCVENGGHISKAVRFPPCVEKGEAP